MLDFYTLHFLLLSSNCLLSAFPPARNVFRVSSVDPSHSQSHTLHVNDVYHKQQWLNCLRTAQQHRAPAAESAPAKRRSSVCDEETDENCPPVSGPKLRPQTLSKSRLDQKLRGSLKRKETGVQTFNPVHRFPVRHVLFRHVSMNFPVTTIFVAALKKKSL